MSVNVSEILGAPYESKIDAQVDKSPSEVVVTNTGEMFYIVEREVYDNQLAVLGYEIVVAEGE
ncbi:hypothetical protein [Neobacillus cucumis]|uniref:hypothetical protein n=1 Tax=Neobacillus cucumis TaxID=1740721 RepID=UPI002E21B029|nr:hypothetical protein [Neobacillus cucumis]